MQLRALPVGARGRRRTAGFLGITTLARAAPYFDLWAVASKPARSDAELNAFAAADIPI